MWRDQGDYKTAKSGVLLDCTKYIGVKVNFVRQLRDKFVLMLEFVRTDDNVGDIFYKGPWKDSLPMFVSCWEIDA